MRTFLAIAILLLLSGISISRNALWQDDEKIWSGTIKAFPRKARSYNEVGLHMLDTGRYEEAYRYLTRSLELDPYQQPVWNNLARVYDHLGRTDDAVRTFERAIGNAPYDATPYYNLGVLYFDRLKNPDRALDYLLGARDLNPLEPDVHYQLSRIYTALGDTTRAREELARYRHLKR